LDNKFFKKNYAVAHTQIDFIYIIYTFLGYL